MPMLVDDAQRMLRDSAQSFFREHAHVGTLRALRDEGDPAGLVPGLWALTAEMGFNGVIVPEADGGIGLGHVEAGIVLEQMGRNLSASPFLASSVGAVTALGYAAPELRSHWSGVIAQGMAIATLAIDEGNRHGPDRIALRARFDGDNLVLDGAKALVPHGHVADLFIVAAILENVSGGASVLVAVPVQSAGIVATPYVGLDSGRYADVVFQDVRVPRNHLVGTVNEGGRILDHVLDALRLGAAAELIGVAGEAFDRTIDYMKGRRQFDVAIGSFQSLQHRVAHLYAELEVARAALLKAQQLFDIDHVSASAAVSVAKVMTELAATLSVQEGVQLHGGVGMTDEFDMGLFMKRAKVLGALYGNADYHAERLAQFIGY